MYKELQNYLVVCSRYLSELNLSFKILWVDLTFTNILFHLMNFVGGVFTRPELCSRISGTCSIACHSTFSFLLPISAWNKISLFNVRMIKFRYRQPVTKPARHLLMQMQPVFIDRIRNQFLKKWIDVAMINI
jgi:hypothetical protein